MIATSLIHQLQGPFNFLRLEPEELRRLGGDGELALPRPQRVFLEDEVATPRHGFPVLQSEGRRALETALGRFLHREETLQVAIYRRQPSDRKAYNQAWETYRHQLVRAVENVTLSSYGRQYPGLFWLCHSLDVARVLKETPRRIARQDTEIGRNHGDTIKYRVYDRWVDRVLETTYDAVHGLAVDTDEVEEELFPPLLNRMVDNVLVFTEDHISPNLGELGSYFSGHLRIDGRDLRQRLERLDAWHREALARDAELRAAVSDLLGADPDRARDLLVRPGYVSFLASRPSWSADELLDERQVAVWDRLLVKLKEFELFHGLRRLVLPVERDGDDLVCRRASLNRTLVGQPELRLSATTRPMDFLAPWVVDPLVHRFGMIYDIADFSEVVSVLRRSGSETQDDSFRKMFRFQRRVNRIATGYRLNLEKYLGDGAFFSSRRARRMLVASIHVQRLYSQALDEGFPFDRGMRIALNSGQYRLIPIDTGRRGSERYEFFGHGLVELSRMTTGKATREIEEIQTMLINLGYRSEVVQRFFSPLLKSNVDMVDKREEDRRYYAYINQNGHLVNEGMVATAPFLDELAQEQRFEPFRRALVEDRTYVVVELEDSAEETTLPVGLRRLGEASLKGLEPLPIYEVVDLGDAPSDLWEPLAGGDLVRTIDREANRPGATSASPTHHEPR